MDYQQIASDTKYSVRTQISLSESLYRAVKKKAKKAEKSIAQLTREALLKEICSESKNKTEKNARLRALAKEARGMIKAGDKGWGQVKNPSKLIRKWREAEERGLQRKLGF